LPHPWRLVCWGYADAGVVAAVAGWRDNSVCAAA